MRTNHTDRLRYGCVVLVLALTSCFKTNHNISPASPSILQFIAGDSSLSILNAAITRVRLDTTMTSGGPYTFFAPSDSAFLAAGLTMDSINRMNPQQLLQILEYEVVNGRISALALPGFLKQQFTSLHPLYEPFIAKNYYGIFINGIPAIGAGNTAGDGIVQVIGRVAFPPPGSQLQVLSQQPDMTFMAALVRHVYALNLVMANPDPNSFYDGFNTYVQSTPLYGNTMLVPTDSAWRAFGYTDSVAFYSDSNNLVYGYFDQTGNFREPLLPQYMFNGFIFTCDLKGQFPINGGSVIQYRDNVQAYMITSLDGMSFTGNGIAPGNPVKIISPDIIASNGVIQKINQVFISHS